MTVDCDYDNNNNNNNSNNNNNPISLMNHANVRKNRTLLISCFIIILITASLFTAQIYLMPPDDLIAMPSSADNFDLLPESN